MRVPRAELPLLYIDTLHSHKQFPFFVLPVTVPRETSSTRCLVAISAGRCAVKKRVLVTGGAGFLGSHLCARLLEQECEVLCVDNYFTGTRRNIEPLLGEPAFEAMRHDVTFPLYVEVDEIYNLACPASPIHYQHDPAQATKT